MITCAYAHHDLSRTTLKKLAEFFQTDHLHSTLCDDPVLSRVLLLFNFRVTRRWRGADSRSSQNAIDATYLLTSDSFRAEQLLPPLQDAQHEAQLRELGELQEGVHRRRLVRRDLFRAARDRVGDAPLPRRVNSRGNINSLSTQSSPQRREGAHLQHRAHKFPISARSAVASKVVALRGTSAPQFARPAGVSPPWSPRASVNAPGNYLHVTSPPLSPPMFIVVPRVEGVPSVSAVARPPGR